MTQHRTRVDLPQPLVVRLEEPPPPTLLSWRVALGRHRGLVALVLGAFLVFLLSFAVAYALTIRAQSRVTLTQGVCQAQGWLDYPRRSAVGAPLHLRLTLQAPPHCPFVARVVWRPTGSAAQSPPEALTPLVQEVNLPAGGLTTLEATLRPAQTGTLLWQVEVPGQPAEDVLAQTEVWGRWADALRRLAWALLTLSFLGPLSALLGLWPYLRAWAHRLRRP